MPDEESGKIIIDEDWKAQVDRERDEIRQTPGAEAAEEPSAEPVPGFSSLISYLGTQAAGAMGMFAPPDATEVRLNLEAAQFIINCMMVLREKTAGNLTPEEEGQLKRFISDLQSAFVECSQMLQEAQLRGEGGGESLIVEP